MGSGEGQLNDQMGREESEFIQLYSYVLGMTSIVTEANFPHCL